MKKQRRRQTLEEKIKFLEENNREVMPTFEAPMTKQTIAASKPEDPNSCQIATALQNKFRNAERIYVRLKMRKKEPVALADFSLDGVRYTWELDPLVVPLLMNWDTFRMPPSSRVVIKPLQLLNVKIGGRGALEQRGMSKAHLLKLRQAYRERVKSGEKLRKRFGVPQVRKNGFVCRGAPPVQHPALAV